MKLISYLPNASSDGIYIKIINNITIMIMAGFIEPNLRLETTCTIVVNLINQEFCRPNLIKGNITLFKYIHAAIYTVVHSLI